PSDLSRRRTLCCPKLVVHGPEFCRGWRPKIARARSRASAAPLSGMPAHPALCAAHSILEMAERPRPHFDELSRSLVAQAEHALGLREAGHRKFTKVHPVIDTGAGERGGRDHGAVQLARDLLQPRGEIDGGPDAGEVEPAHAADIAEQDAADMQG